MYKNTKSNNDDLQSKEDSKLKEEVELMLIAWVDSNKKVQSNLTKEDYIDFILEMYY